MPSKDSFMYTVGDQETVTEAIVSAVAHLKDENVEDLPPLYYEGPDPDGLNMLFSSEARGHIEFAYYGTTVLIQHGNEIIVTPKEKVSYFS